MRRSVKPAECAAWLDSGEPIHAVGFLLKSLHHSLRQSMDEALRARGVALSFAHFATLFGLQFEPGIPGAELARRVMVSAQTMNAILRRLEADGLIARRPHPESRRADSWSLTDSGEAELARARVIGDGVFSQMLSALAPAEIADFQAYLGRCIAALEAKPAAQRAAAPAAARRARAGRQSAAR